jgi:ABC-type transport system involved in cytochrome bd biosynthesis fused ATPase/permease subunit
MGPSGTGKTTLLYMLMGLVPSSGEIRVNGGVLSNPKFPREDILLISPRDPLFKISIRSNLTLGEPFSDDEIKRVLEVVGADFIASLDAVVGSVDFNLSWGQEQRIRLARGILHKSKILLLDEPFTGLDETLKVCISSRLKKELSDRAVVLVTHDPEDLRLVDVAFRMEAGELVRLSSLNRLS